MRMPARSCFTPIGNPAEHGRGGLLNPETMTIDIEKKAAVRKSSQPFRDFVVAVERLKPGESFTIDNAYSNHRLVLSAAQVWFRTKYSVVRDGKKWRIGRIV